MVSVRTFLLSDATIELLMCNEKTNHDDDEFGMSTKKRDLLQS